MRWLRYWIAWLWWKIRAFAFDHAVKALLAILVVAAVVLYLLPDIVVTINSGESGVLWKRFGGGTVTVDDDGKQFRSRISTDASGKPTTLTEENQGSGPQSPDETWPYDEGMHLKWPWDRIFVYNIRLQEVTTTYDALTSDGLAIKVEVTIRWKPIEEDLGKLHRDVGPDYVQTLLVPLVGSFARQEIAAHKPDALYSPDRLTIQETIREKTKQALISRFRPEADRESYLLVEDVLIRNVDLPDDVAQAIEEKVVQKQQAEAFEYRLARERQEAERKAIEAEGIRRFQETINSTISEGYLRWKGIEATLELAKSDNAKVVVIGAGEGGMPLILGGLDGVGGAANPAPRVSPRPRPSPAAQGSPVASPAPTTAAAPLPAGGPGAANTP